MTVAMAFAGLLAAQLLLVPFAEGARVAVGDDALMPQKGAVPVVPCKEGARVAVGDDALVPEKGAVPVALAQGQADLKQTAAALKTSGCMRGERACGIEHSAVCHEGEACWSSKPSADSTPKCLVDSGTTTCLCPTEECVIDKLNQQLPKLGRCTMGTVYSFAKSDVGNEAYCHSMEKKDDWKAKHLVKLRSDPPAANDKPQSECAFPDTWHDGQCQRTTRYLGESCWGHGYDPDSEGICEDGHERYNTACFKGKCVPLELATENTPCTCKRTDIKLDLCVAADDKCGGHPCVTDRVHREELYCDYEAEVMRIPGGSHGDMDPRDHNWG